MLDFVFFFKLAENKLQVTYHTPSLIPMPPRKKAVQVDDTDDETRVQTRSSNVSRHSGTEAQDALRVRKPRRAPEIIQKEKDQQRLKREAKAREKQEEKMKQEAAERELEQYRSQQEVDIEKEGAMFPRHQSKGMWQIISSFLNLM